jgi:hypothetical protein
MYFTLFRVFILKNTRGVKGQKTAKRNDVVFVFFVVRDVLRVAAASATVDLFVYVLPSRSERWIVRAFATTHRFLERTRRLDLRW